VKKISQVNLNKAVTVRNKDDRQIVHLSSAHPAKDVRIYHKECWTLADQFGLVLLVARHGKRERDNGVEIQPAKQYGGRLARMTLGTLNVGRQALAARTRIVHFHDPELIPVGLVLRALGKKVIYDVHEDLPRQLLTKRWLAPALRRLVGLLTEAFEWGAANCLSGIVAATPTIGNRFPKSKTVVVRNYPRIDEFVGGARVPYQGREPGFVYAGVISANRGAREMVTAIGLMPEESRSRVVLAGNTSPLSFSNELAKTSGWRRVDFVGWLNRDQVAQALGKARAGLLLLHPKVNYLASLPTNLFEYMAAGLPVIASDFPQWRAIIEEEKCGLMVDPLDPQAIAGAMQYILMHPQEAEAMGERDQRAVQQKYNWEAESRILIDFYRRFITA
jgi:glycosyltransferase involved in cell wall biosynthesis